MINPTKEDVEWMTDRAIQLIRNGTPRADAIIQAAREGQERAYERNSRTKQLRPGLTLTLADIARTPRQQRKK